MGEIQYLDVVVVGVPMTHKEAQRHSDESDGGFRIIREFRITVTEMSGEGGGRDINTKYETSFE